MNMTAGEYVKFVEQLREDEGFRSKAYVCPAGKMTIGYGRNLEDKGISMSEGETLLVNDLAEIQLRLPLNLPLFKDLHPVRQAVLMNMAYNLGVRGLLNFKRMCAALEREDYAAAAKEMLDSKWAEQVGGRAERLAEEMRRAEWQE